MRKFYVLVAGLCFTGAAMAQTDTSNPAAKKEDTVKVGGFIIVKKGNGQYDAGDGYKERTHHHHQQNLSTNWLIIDLGFANYIDHTNYADAAAAGVVMPGVGKEQFTLRYGKSVDVNIWLFMQRLNLIKHIVNLKYGLGIELNNYRYESNLLYNKDNNIFTIDQTRNYTKNKLATDYVTIPLMLNFNFTPQNSYNRSFGLSAGVSVGYLYSSRQKVITLEDGKQKIHDDFYIDPFKISYVGEVQLGFIKFYGSLATQSIFGKGLDQTPYTFGLRLSNW